jgi:hypothetical protein
MEKRVYFSIQNLTHTKYMCANVQSDVQLIFKVFQSGENS